MSGKKSWPELVGVDGQEAQQKILAENSSLNVIILKYTNNKGLSG